MPSQFVCEKHFLQRYILRKWVKHDLNGRVIAEITKRNKATSARETVYDRCAYIGCYNGKFINGRKLFHFPAEMDRRLEMWIERSGNFRLRTWAATSLRKAGLCGDHFDERSFTNATRETLRRNVVPRHYSEELKFRKASQENLRDSEVDVSVEVFVNGATEQRNDLTDCVDPSWAVLAEPFTGNVSRRDEICREFRSGKPIKLEPGTRSSSPVVEFIVEELDESLIRETSRLPTGQFESCSNVRDEERAAEAEDRTTGSSTRATTETDENPCTGEADSRDEDPVSNGAFHLRESDHPKVPGDEEEPGGPPANDSEEQSPEVSICCPHTNETEGKTLACLRNENKYLRRAIRLLKQNLRRSDVRKAENPEPSNASRTAVDEFLDAQGCTSPVARAMVKLALHKPRTPYTTAEREFATRLYRNSSTAFADLQRSGCNLPGRNTVKGWIAEDEGKRKTGAYLTMTTPTTDEAGVDAGEIYLEEDDGGQSEPMTIDAYVTLEQPRDLEIAVDALVAEHTEVQTAAEEYVETSAIDYHPEVFQ